MPSGTVATIDDPTFTALLQRSTPKLHDFVRRLVGQNADADDVLQEALARAWRLRGSFDTNRGSAGSGDDRARAWLNRIAFRVFCDLRDQKKRQPGGIDQVDLHPAQRTPCTTELRDEVSYRLQGLPEIERILLLGFHQNELSLRELATRHGLPVNTVKSHLHRARQRLQATRNGRPS